jgi:hypothetical protein
MNGQNLAVGILDAVVDAPREVVGLQAVPMVGFVGLNR